MKNPNPPLTPDLWRLSIIGELMHRHPDDDRTLAERLTAHAKKIWEHPDGSTCQVAAETLRKWLSRFRAGGLTALDDARPCPGTRIPDPIAEAITRVRGEKPCWTVKLITDHLHETGVWNAQQPSLATLDRWCKAKGFLRARRGNQPAGRAFEFTAFGALWLSDVLHGPAVRVDGRNRKTYLLAIIDDASRFVVSARFHLSEGVEPLMVDLRQALMRFGAPQQFYSDNGAAYRSQILHQVGARLGITMPHTPAYQPQGRGKIERHFRTVRERFLAANTAKTIEPLNLDLQAWLAEYHKTPHGGLGDETPLDKRQRIKNLCRTLPAATNLDALFMQDRLVRVYKDGTFRLQNRLFEAPQAEPGATLHSFFRPWDLTTVFYGPEHRLAKPLDKHANAHRFDHPNAKEATRE